MPLKKRRMLPAGAGFEPLANAPLQSEPSVDITPLTKASGVWPLSGSVKMAPQPCPTRQAT